jgi:hypothetical protein
MEVMNKFPCENCLILVMCKSLDYSDVTHQEPLEVEYYINYLVPLTEKCSLLHQYIEEGCEMYIDEHTTEYYRRVNKAFKFLIDPVIITKEKRYEPIKSLIHSGVGANKASNVVFNSAMTIWKKDIIH